MTLFPFLRNAALASALALGAAAGAFAADFSGLQSWVGQHPSNRIGGRSFFDYPGLRAEMQKAMGQQAYRALQRMRGPEGIVVRVGDYIAAWRCQQHDCGDKNSTIVARLAKGDVAVCWLEAPGRPARRWYIPGRGTVDDGTEGCPFEAADIAAAIRRLGL